MKFYYGYISGTYLHNKNNVGMMPCTDIKSIVEHTYSKDTEDSVFQRWGIEDGWSSVITEKVDWDFTYVANPIRTVLELLYDHKFADAECILRNMFGNNVSSQEVSIACCDLLMKYDKDGKIYDFLVEHIPLFQTTMVNRANFLLKQKELEKQRKEEKNEVRRKSTYGITEA